MNNHIRRLKRKTTDNKGIAPRPGSCPHEPEQHRYQHPVIDLGKSFSYMYKEKSPNPGITPAYATAPAASCVSPAAPHIGLSSYRSAQALL